MPIKNIRAFCVDNLNNSMSCAYDELSVCPVCHHALVPSPLHAHYVPPGGHLGGPEAIPVYIAFFCTRCRNIFTVEYGARHQISVSAELATLYTQGIYPQTPNKTEFPASIVQISPSFVVAYNQSEVAEANRLTEIAGCGYRKSIEYLVKDYLCSRSPKNEDAIKAEFLGNSIKRISEERIRILAERATWIGNDETHYVRKHEALDIADMKQFIVALTGYIDLESQFERALSISPCK